MLSGINLIKPKPKSKTQMIRKPESVVNLFTSNPTDTCLKIFEKRNYYEKSSTENILLRYYNFSVL